MEKETYMQFIVTSHHFATFISRHGKRYNNIVVKDGAVFFCNEDGEYPYYPNDIRSSLDSRIGVANVRFDWVAIDMAGVGEQPVLVKITPGKLRIELDY